MAEHIRHAKRQLLREMAEYIPVFISEKTVKVIDRVALHTRITVSTELIWH